MPRLLTTVVALLLAAAGSATRAAEATPSTRKTGDKAPGGASDKRIDVSAVITKGDAEATLGEPVKDAQPRNEDGGDGYYSRCNYYAQNDKKSLVLRVYKAAPGFDAKQEFKMLSAGTGKLKPIDDLGDRAGLFTAGPQSGLSHVMMLYVAKGNTLVTIGLGGLDDENAALEKAKGIAKKILKQL